MITVMGAGAFGTALAISLAEAGQAVTLWSRDRGQVLAMRQSRENAQRLPGIPLPDALSIQADIPATADPVLLAVPMQRMRDVIDEHHAMLDGRALIA